VDEARVSRLHSAVKRLHVARKNFFRHGHRPRWGCNGRVRLLSPRPRFHVSKQPAVSNNSPRQIVESGDQQLVHAYRLARRQPRCERDVRHRKHPGVDEVLTVYWRHAGGEYDSDSGIQQSQGCHFARGPLAPALTGQDHAKTAATDIAGLDHSTAAKRAQHERAQPVVVKETIGIGFNDRVGRNVAVELGN
jgi:hypothetical protein